MECVLAIVRHPDCERCGCGWGVATAVTEAGKLQGVLPEERYSFTASAYLRSTTLVESSPLVILAIV